MLFKRATLAAIAVLTTSAAMAGDLATKAPALAVASNPCQVATASTPLSCSGFYVGAGLSGAGSNADIIGNGIAGSVFAGGVTPSFDAGYQYAAGNWLFGAEIDLGYRMSSGTSVNGVTSNVSGFRATELFKVGGNLSALLGSQQPITIPPSLANSVIAPYAAIGTTQWLLPGNKWASGVTSGAGLLFDIGPRVFGDLRYTYTNFNGAQAKGLSVQNDQSLMVAINFKLN